MKKPKILFLDIETSPNLVWSWVVGRKVNLLHENIEKERQIICICWKFSDSPKVYSVDWGAAKFDDKQLLKEFAPIVEQADLVVAQNGDKYDIRFINGRLLHHKLPPLASHVTEDTLKQSRAAFYLNSHSLEYGAKFSKIGQKLPTSMSLWRKVCHGDEKALKYMVKYCKQDVLLLEKYYNRIAPYVPHRVNKSVLVNQGKAGCPSCGEKQAVKNGWTVSGSVIYNRFRCAKCYHPYKVARKYGEK